MQMLGVGNSILREHVFLGDGSGTGG